MLAENTRSSSVGFTEADIAWSAGRACVSLNSGVSSWTTRLALVYSTKSSSSRRVNEPTSWTEDLYLSTPWASVLIITRYRCLGTTRAVVIHWTVYFLESSFLVAIVATSASLLHHSFSGAEITRRALNGPSRTQRAVIAIDTRNTVLLFLALYLVKVGTRGTRLRLDSTSDTEVTFRALATSYISDTHLIAEVSGCTLLALVLVDTLQKGIECSLRTLEHERVVKLLISSRWAPVTDRTGVSSSVSVLTDHTRLTASAIG